MRQGVRLKLFAKLRLSESAGPRQNVKLRPEVKLRPNVKLKPSERLMPLRNLSCIVSDLAQVSLSVEMGSSLRTIT